MKLLHTCIAFFLTILIAGFSHGQTPVGESTQSHQRLETELRHKVSAEYLLHLPRGYEKEGSKRWPLILFLHGAGERGDDLTLVKRHGPPKIVEARPDFPFIVVSPQCPRGRIWSNEVLLVILDEVVAGHAVDTDRIYLTGLSMGGFGTWSLAAQAAERFAAIAPVCGGGSRIYVLTLRDMPVWAFHGAQDRVVPLEETERMVETLKRRGNEKVKFTVYPEANHDSWTETYDNEELYEWFLTHSLKDR